MRIIPRDGTFIKNGGVVLDDKELKVMTQAFYNRLGRTWQRQSVPKGSTFCDSEVTLLTEREVTTLICALAEERDRVVKANGNQYGEMTIEELNNLITQLQRYQKERGRSP